MYEGLPDRIRADYPKLTEKEYRTCVLLSVGLDYDVISGILDDRGGTIHNRTSRIRDKLALPSRIDLRVFFQEKYFC